MYKFGDGVDIETLLLESIEDKLLLPSSNPDEVVYFANGDKLTVNLASRTLLWEPINPGEFTTSKLAMRVHQWFAKGYIKPIQ